MSGGTTYGDLESPKELQGPERHQIPVQKTVQKRSEHGAVGKWSTRVLRAKKCNGPTHLLAQLICLSCCLDCVNFLRICAMLVGLFLSVRAHHNRGMLQNLFPSWGKWRGRSLSLCVGSRGQGGEGKSPLAKYLEFSFPVLKLVSSHLLLLANISSIYFFFSFIGPFSLLLFIQS